MRIHNFPKMKKDKNHAFQSSNILLQKKAIPCSSFLMGSMGTGKLGLVENRISLKASSKHGETKPLKTESALF
jgi:hypothetical protein